MAWSYLRKNGACARERYDHRTSESYEVQAYYCKIPNQFHIRWQSENGQLRPAGTSFGEARPSTVFPIHLSTSV